MPGQIDESSQLPAPVPPLPAVSVIIPVYNASDYIAGALESVFSQTFSAFEAILVNDGSEDRDRLQQALTPYRSRMIYLEQENRGPSAARNRAIQQARGEWLAFLDADDLWLPSYLEQQMNFMRGDPGLDMVFCDAVLESDSIPTGKTFMQVCPSEGPVTFDSILVERTQVLTSGTVVRRKLVEAAGLFDEAIHCSEDHDLWLRIAHQGARISYQRQALLRRRLRPDSQGTSLGLLAGEVQSLTKLDRVLQLSPQSRQLLHARLRQMQARFALVEGKKFLLAGRLEQARDSLGRSLALAPTMKLRAMLLGLRVAPGLAARAARFWHNLTLHPVPKA